MWPDVRCSRLPWALCIPTPLPSITALVHHTLHPTLQPEEDEEEEEAAAYQRASEQPSGRRRALPRGGSQGRGVRGQLALAAVEQEEAEEEQQQGQQWDEGYEEQQDEGEEEEEVPVLPTEEQLPTGWRGGRAPRQRRLQPMFAPAEDEEEEDGEGEEEVRGSSYSCRGFRSWLWLHPRAHLCCGRT